jgi:hypothetical protein
MQLVERIIKATEHPEAVDAFTSIVLSPESAVSFEEMIEDLTCPVCLAYGAWQHQHPHNMFADQRFQRQECFTGRRQTAAASINQSGIPGFENPAPLQWKPATA